ncbi:MAG: hypothetical protein M3332_11310 [Actinomycetota bacterium]|nr:hypothetical protein [Actinomycetota bacterium]
MHYSVSLIREDGTWARTSNDFKTLSRLQQEYEQRAARRPIREPDLKPDDRGEQRTCAAEGRRICEASLP